MLRLVPVALACSLLLVPSLVAEEAFEQDEWLGLDWSPFQGSGCLLPDEGIEYPSGRFNPEGDDIRNTCERPATGWERRVHYDVPDGFSNSVDLKMWCAAEGQRAFDEYHDPFRACMWHHAIEADWLPPE